MEYVNLCGKKVSRLGLGTMRLPDDPLKPVNYEKAAEMFEYAVKHGVNYFDTAFGYHCGDSEPSVGRILKNYPRDSFNIATKFPGYEHRESWNAKEQFESQLQRLGVDYFDYYLVHNVCENDYPTYTDKRWNILDYIFEQKDNGRIKHLGFSSHGLFPLFKEFLDKYGDRMEFCLIELNAVDWTLQDAKAKYDELVKRGIPILVMEPLRGGLLAKFPPEQQAELDALRPGASAVSWAYNWLLSLPGVSVVLSGSSSLEQLKENIAVFDSPKPLSDAEKKVYEKVANSVQTFIPCTQCGYCVSKCPQKLDIPFLLKQANNCKIDASFITAMLLDSMPEDKIPDACKKCGNCTEVCPQGIDVSSEFEELLEKLNAVPEVFRTRRIHP